MVIQFRRVLIHNLLRILRRILMMQSRTLLILLLLRVIINEQVFNLARARSGLVHGETRGELFVRTDLDSVQQKDREVLAVVANDVVGWPGGSHVVDYHLT